MQETGNAGLTSVESHYQNHLAAIYSWMSGNFIEESQKQYELYNKCSIRPRSTGIALDLGSGHGIHTAALAQLGFTVIAVDFNKQLLEELKNNTLGWGTHCIQMDILNVGNIPANPELIVCTGDTILHLPDELTLITFIKNIARKLVSGGTLILSFRDYSIEKNGNDRFIPVKSDDTKILTCVVDYEDRYIRVTDLLHIKINDKWEQHVSSYHKLRINPGTIRNHMLENQLQIDNSFNDNGMVYILATKL